MSVHTTRGPCWRVSVLGAGCALLLGCGGGEQQGVTAGTSSGGHASGGSSGNLGGSSSGGSNQAGQGAGATANGGDAFAPVYGRYGDELYRALAENTGKAPHQNPDVWQALPAPADDVRLAAGSPHAGLGVRWPPAQPALP